MVMSSKVNFFSYKFSYHDWARKRTVSKNRLFKKWELFSTIMFLNFSLWGSKVSALSHRSTWADHMLDSVPNRSTIALCASRILTNTKGIYQVTVCDGVLAASLLTFGWLLHNSSSIGSWAQAASWSKWTTPEKCLYSQGHFGLSQKTCHPVLNTHPAWLCVFGTKETSSDQSG